MTKIKCKEKKPDWLAEYLLEGSAEEPKQVGVIFYSYLIMQIAALWIYGRPWFPA